MSDEDGIDVGKLLSGFYGEPKTVEQLLAENAALRERVHKAIAFAKKVMEDAMDSVPAEYADRDLHYKYLRMDNYSGGAYECAEDILAILEATDE